MIKEAMEWIKEQTLPQVIGFEDGRSYSTRKLEPMLEPIPAPLPVHTLQGIVDYLGVGVDGAFLSKDQAYILIQDPAEVLILQGVTPHFFQRPALLFSQAVLPDLNGMFGRYMPVEEFLIKLKSLFVYTEDRDEIIKIAGNLVAENNIRQQDDGFSQTVTAKSGVARVSEVSVKSWYSLAPYRTFQEINQPESPFIFRMRGDAREGVDCALFEADGGAWRIDGVDSIHEWLKDRVSVPIIR